MGDRIFTSERLPLLDEKTKQKPKDLSKDYGDLCLIADGFAQVYPEHKWVCCETEDFACSKAYCLTMFDVRYLIVECLREMNYTVGMTGDGVNDGKFSRAEFYLSTAIEATTYIVFRNSTCS